MVETRRESGSWKAKHGRILAAALDEFIGRGFNGGSMDRIAAKAKVSKVTIYNHFENKDLLYRNTIDYYLHQVHPGTPTITDSPDLAPKQTLMSYGVALIELTTSPKALGMLRLLRADPPAVEEAAMNHHETKLLPDAKHIASYLAKEEANGRLKVPNVDVAARQFIGMIFENTLYPALMGMNVDLSKSRVGDVVDSSVSMFLRHYGR